MSNMRELLFAAGPAHIAKGYVELPGSRIGGTMDPIDIIPGEPGDDLLPKVHG
jgi:hypothetical protein